MAEITAAIRAALDSDEPIERELVRTWIRQAEDLETLALLYRLSYESWDQIEPNLEKDETCRLIGRYLLICIRESPQDGTGLRRYEAAAQLESWVDHLSDMEGTQGNLQEVATAITKLFIDSNDDVRDAIETGFLEHVLEQAKLRPLFLHWGDDTRLKDSWTRALAWGEAHPDYMKGIRGKLRAL